VTSMPASHDPITAVAVNREGSATLQLERSPSPGVWLVVSPGSCRRPVPTGVAPSATLCDMGAEEITQRDLRSRSREIMDSVEHGQSFTVTRDGYPIGELIPLRRRRRFVSRQEFAAMSRNAPDVGLEAFRVDQDAAADQEAGSVYEQ